MIAHTPSITSPKVVSLVGFGLIGKERAKALERLRNRGLPVSCSKIFDPYQKDILSQAAALGPLCAKATVADSFDEVLASRPDLIIIACPHDQAATYASRALSSGVSILVEKPLGRTSAEARSIIAAENTAKLQVGFNYRYMAGVSALIADCQSGRFGRLISISMQLGHGGSPQDRDSWKLDPQRCGGGVLLDPGIHLLDLLSCLDSTYPWAPLAASAWSGFWNTGIDEETHVLLRAGELLATLQVSVVRWRSTFSIQVLGCDGYGCVSGRGRSYGPQTYVRGKRWGWQDHASQAASETLVCESTCEDAFADELAACLGFTPAIRPSSASSTYLSTMELYEEILRHTNRNSIHLGRGTE